MKSFISKLTVLTLVLALIGWLLFSLVFPEYYLPILPLLLLFFYLVSLGIHAFLYKQAKKNVGKFTRASMLVTLIKLVVYSTIAVVYIAFNRENAYPFVACLLLLYVIYTVLEVREITTTVKRKRKK